MIHFKNKSHGFTLLEVLFALVILGAALTPLMLNQTRLYSRVAYEAERLARTFAGLHFMLDSYVKFEQNNEQRKATKALDNLRAALNFSIGEPREGIKKEFKSLYKKEVILEWGEGKVKSQDRLVTFKFLPDVEEKT